MANLYSAPSAENFSTALSSAITAGQTTITVDSVTNLQATTVLVIDRVDANGNLKSTSVWEYVLVTGISGNDLTVTRARGGSNAQQHSAGAIIEAIVTAEQWEGLYTWATALADDNGLLKAIASPVSIARIEVRQLAVSSIASIAQFNTSSFDTAQLAVSSIASLAQAHITNFFNANATITARVNVGQIALTSTASAATSEFDIRNQSGHIDIRPGTNKLVKIAVLRQDDTTDSYKNNSVILTGWGYKVGDGSTSQFDETVTFGIAFAQAPVVLITNPGTRDGSNPVAISDFNSGNAYNANSNYVGTYNITATNFVANMTTRNGGVSSNTYRYGYAWIAIGEL